MGKTNHPRLQVLKFLKPIAVDRPTPPLLARIEHARMRPKIEQTEANLKKDRNRFHFREEAVRQVRPTGTKPAAEARKKPWLRKHPPGIHTMPVGRLAWRWEGLGPSSS
jgi:hypothetical protein